MSVTNIDYEAIGRIIVDTAIQVHKALGPGLLESAYQQCHSLELRARGLHVDNEVLLPIVYKGLPIETGFRIDTLIEGCVVIENKAVDQLLPIHEAQLLTYMRLGNYLLGYLLN
jgi:GxxExxY protein